MATLTDSLAKCGSFGPMLCLYGSTCNETLGGVCDQCPRGFRDDQTLFQGNKNCGLNESGMYAVYLVSAVVSTLVSLWAFKVALFKKPSRMRTLLWLVAVWNGFIPFFVLAHWLEGFRFGAGAVVLFTAILCTVNTQVVMHMYFVEKFLSLLVNHSSPDRIFRFHVIWYSVWISIKLIIGILQLSAERTGNTQFFNIVMLISIVGLLIEVSANATRVTLSNARLLRAAKDLQANIVASSNPVITEFTAKVENTWLIAPTYSLIISGCGILFVVLYIVYDSAIPYAYIMFAYLTCTWPILGLRPIFLLRTRLGKQIEKSKTATHTSGNAPDVTRKDLNIPYTHEESHAGSSTPLPGNIPGKPQTQITTFNKVEKSTIHD